MIDKFIHLTKNQDIINISSDLINLLNKYEINTKLRLCYFFARCNVETAGFTKFFESFNYSCDNLKGNKHFTKEQAEKYGRIDTFQQANEKMIGSIMYAERFGNGNIQSEDGYKFACRGWIGLTFKDNYEACSKALYSDMRLLLNPSLISENQYIGCETACWFWKKKNINDLADKDNLRGVVFKINGGYNGLSDTEKKLKEYKKNF